MESSIIKNLKTLSSLKEQLNWLVVNCKKTYMTIIKCKKYNLIFNFIDRINGATPKLNDDVYTLHTKIYWILNDVDDFPKCENDNVPLIGKNVKSALKGYGSIIACCKDCENKVHFKRIMESNLKKYGSENPFQFMSKEIAEKNIKKFGNACPANNKEIRKKIENDNLIKFGFKSYSSTDEFKQKSIASSREHYGTDFPTQSQEVKDKIHNTNREKYGVDWSFQSQEVKDKINRTMIVKYGENYWRKILCGKGNPGQSRRAYSYMLKSEKIIPLFSEDYYVEQRQRGVRNFKFKCKKCGNVFESYWDDGHAKSCPYCSLRGCSNEEEQLFDFMLQLVGDSDIIHSDRKVISPLEIDIYIKDKKLAIEFDGLYWHNDENQSDHRYHLKKTQLCEQKGIQLIHIFENEWLFKEDIVKSRLKNLLGIYDETVFARKCEVKEVDSKTSREFQEKNHIQGAINAKVHLGLFYENELISLMTFGKSRFNKKYEWELLRFCNKLGYHIPGGASRLLKHFERNQKPKSLISYADRRWSQGKLYEALGFQLDHISEPDYWYFNSYEQPILESRVKYQKHKLKNILISFDELKTEEQNMKSNGFHRVFDCGNLVFTKTYV